LLAGHAGQGDPHLTGLQGHGLSTGQRVRRVCGCRWSRPGDVERESVAQDDAGARPHDFCARCDATEFVMEDRVRRVDELDDHRGGVLSSGFFFRSGETSVELDLVQPRRGVVVERRRRRGPHNSGVSGRASARGRQRRERQPDICCGTRFRCARKCDGPIKKQVVRSTARLIAGESLAGDSRGDQIYRCGLKHRIHAVLGPGECQRWFAELCSEINVGDAGRAHGSDARGNSAAEHGGDARHSIFDRLHIDEVRGREPRMWLRIRGVVHLDQQHGLIRLGGQPGEGRQDRRNGGS